jgi:hypothetical protein
MSKTIAFVSIAAFTLDWACWSRPDRYRLGERAGRTDRREIHAVQTAKQLLVSNAQTIQNLALRSTTLDAVTNIATCVTHRIGVDGTKKNQIVQALLNSTDLLIRKHLAETSRCRSASAAHASRSQASCSSKGEFNKSGFLVAAGRASFFRCDPPIFLTHETKVSLVMGSYLQIWDPPARRHAAAPEETGNPDKTRRRRC